MMGELVFTGNKGVGVRSDCFVSLELTSGGGIRLALDSKVDVMFGNSIRKEIHGILDHFNIKDAFVTVEDSGALPFVIAARLEAAINKAIAGEKEFIIPMLNENQYVTSKDRNRFSRLYLPGNTPSLMINAGIHRPNGIILDL
jgi:citrate lyase subunit beta / citryl-CoA lyase